METGIQYSTFAHVHPPEAVPHEISRGSHTRIKQGLVGASLDLKDAYLHVPIHSSDRRWLGFCLKNQVYRFNSLLFGLSTAPRTFTRIIKMIEEHPHLRQKFVFVYLDDWLLTAPSKEELQNAVKETTQLVTWACLYYHCSSISMHFNLNSSSTPNTTVKIVRRRWWVRRSDLSSADGENPNFFNH